MQRLSHHPKPLCSEYNVRLLELGLRSCLADFVTAFQAPSRCVRLDLRRPSDLMDDKMTVCKRMRATQVLYVATYTMSLLLPVVICKQRAHTCSPLQTQTGWRPVTPRAVFTPYYPLHYCRLADAVALPRSADSTYGADADFVREYFSCLQWDCEPGHYSSSLPDCYQDYLTPSSSDDYRAEESDVEECGDDVCCEQAGQKRSCKRVWKNVSYSLICEVG